MIRRLLTLCLIVLLCGNAFAYEGIPLSPKTEPTISVADIGMLSMDLGMLSYIDRWETQKRVDVLDGGPQVAGISSSLNADLGLLSSVDQTLVGSTYTNLVASSYLYTD